MCIYVLARDAASPWAERSKQIAAITSDWSLILHHGLLFILYTENAKNTSHIRSYQTLLFISLCFFCFLCIGHCGYFFSGSVMISFCHVMNQILIHVLFALFIPDCVEYIGVDLIVYIWCTVFFCFFCDWRRQQKADMSQSHSTSETKRRRLCRRWRPSRRRMLPNR